MATIEERHSELFQPISTESPRGKARTVPMQALCLGFNRTGTSTMSAAMEKLGIPCWHSFRLLSTNFPDNEMWQEAIDRKFFGKGDPFGRAEFDQLLHGFGAISSDTPAIAFSEDLIAAYPEAKVVLVERNIDSWYQSYMSAIIENMFHPISSVLYHLDRSFIHVIGKVQRTTVEGWLGIKSMEDAEHLAKQRYREYYAFIRKITPPERLLEFELEQGWAPLCEFLGKPVPDEPFPHLNDQTWFDEKVKLLIARQTKTLFAKAFYPTTIAFAAVMIWYALRK